MRAYQPIDASPADKAPSPSKPRASRPKPPQPAYDPQPAPEPPQVLARIPNLADPSPSSDQNSDADLDDAGKRGFGWPLRILVGGVILLSVVVLRPVVWPLISGTKNKATETGDQPAEWPASPGLNAAAPKWDAKGDQPASWPRDNAWAGPARRATPQSEHSPGASSDPWADALTPPVSRQPMASRDQGQQAFVDPLSQRELGSDPRNAWNAGPNAITADSAETRASWNATTRTFPSPGSYDSARGEGSRDPGSTAQAAYRMAVRPQYPSEPSAARDPDLSNGSPLGSYPQFTNANASQDRSSWDTVPRAVPGDGYRDRAPAETSRRFDSSAGPADLAGPSYVRPQASTGYQTPPPSTGSLPYGSPPGSQDRSPAGYPPAAAGYPPAVGRAWEWNAPPGPAYRSYAPASAGPEADRATAAPGTAPRGDYPSTGVPAQWNYPSTDQTGRDRSATSSSGPSWGPNPRLGDGNPAADPGVARLEGTIDKSNVQTSYERTRPSVY